MHVRNESDSLEDGITQLRGRTGQEREVLCLDTVSSQQVVLVFPAVFVKSG